MSSVLNNVLQDREYLVGGRYSYVDASFLPWYAIVFDIFADKFDVEKDYPHLNAWLGRIKARSTIAKSIRDRDAIMKGN